MIIKCVICGKHAVTGNTVSHSHRATKRRFHVNLQKINIILSGQSTKAYVCTKCIRSGKVKKA